MSLIELRGISKSYGEKETEVHAIQGISLSVDRGALVAVMGPSGSGKSTLLTIAGSLEEPTSGEVLIDGAALSKMSRNDKARLRRRTIGYVFQDFNLLAGLTALENVALPLELDGLPAKRAQATAMAVLEELGLVDRASYYPDQLSGGESVGDDGEAPHAGHGRFELLFEPAGRKVRVPPGVMLFDAASWNGIAIDSTCGGHGTCRKCKVKLLDPGTAISPLDTRAFSVDELREGWRLACRVQVASDLRVEVPPLATRPKAATVGVGRKVILRPAVQKRYVELTEPSLSDQQTDLERVLANLDDLELRVDLQVVRTVGAVLRASDYKVTAVVIDDVLVDIEPGDTTERAFAIAFDLGTTTVVATLLDLATGAPVAVQSMLNKQQSFGADVISRISAIMMDQRALARLSQLAHETLDELAQAVCEAGAVSPSEVYEIAIAGNATMTHIVLGIDPSPLGVAPFVMSTRLFPEILASEVGVRVHERARAVMFPSFGAYVGGDIVAGLLASGMDRDSRLRLFLDIGTNCELVLGNSERLIATAAPAGPASKVPRSAAACGPHRAPSRS
jgi:ferredoxin